MNAEETVPFEETAEEEESDEDNEEEMELWEGVLESVGVLESLGPFARRGLLSVRDCEPFLRRPKSLARLGGITVDQAHQLIAAVSSLIIEEAAIESEMEKTTDMMNDRTKNTMTTVSKENGRFEKINQPPPSVESAVKSTVLIPTRDSFTHTSVEITADDTAAADADAEEVTASLDDDKSAVDCPSSLISGMMDYNPNDRIVCEFCLNPVTSLMYDNHLRHCAVKKEKESNMDVADHTAVTDAAKDTVDDRLESDQGTIPAPCSVSEIEHYGKTSSVKSNRDGRSGSVSSSLSSKSSGSSSSGSDSMSCKSDDEVLKGLETEHQKAEPSDEVITQVECTFCEMPQSLLELEEHENYCGSRTELCPICGKRDMKQSFHSGIHQCNNSEIQSESVVDIVDNNNNQTKDMDQIIEDSVPFGDLSLSSSPGSTTSSRSGRRRKRSNRRRNQRASIEKHGSVDATEARGSGDADAGADTGDSNTPTMAQCQWCNDMIHLKDLDLHEFRCGKKTKVCDRPFGGCGKVDTWDNFRSGRHRCSAAAAYSRSSSKWQRRRFYAGPNHRSKHDMFHPRISSKATDSRISRNDDSSFSLRRSHEIKDSKREEMSGELPDFDMKWDPHYVTPRTDIPKFERQLHSLKDCLLKEFDPLKLSSLSLSSSLEQNDKEKEEILSEQYRTLLDLLDRIVSNILQSPWQRKCRVLKCDNEVLKRANLFNYSSISTFLELIGFEFSVSYNCYILYYATHSSLTIAKGVIDYYRSNYAAFKIEQLEKQRRFNETVQISKNPLFEGSWVCKKCDHLNRGRFNRTCTHCRFQRKDEDPRRKKKEEEARMDVRTWLCHCRYRNSISLEYCANCSASRLGSEIHPSLMIPIRDDTSSSLAEFPPIIANGDDSNGFSGQSRPMDVDYPPSSLGRTEFVDDHSLYAWDYQH